MVIADFELYCKIAECDILYRKSFNALLQMRQKSLINQRKGGKTLPHPIAVSPPPSFSLDYGKCECRKNRPTKRVVSVDMDEDKQDG